MLAENAKLPPKQRHTGHLICQELRKTGYQGSEPTVRRYIAQQRREKRRPKVYLPLEFDPATDAQADWGEAVAGIAGAQITVQVFYMRLCYSRKLFMMVFPAQNQETFFEGHVQAFHYFGGVPHRITYNNLKTTVQKILAGRTRQKQVAFVALRSHYLFASHFCTPGQGNQKGEVEHAVGFGRRNFLVPIPQVASFAAPNALLLARCQEDDTRQVARQAVTIGEAWALERPLLRVLPAQDYAFCVSKPVALTPYSQVEFANNRYSVPADRVAAHRVVKAYPFRVDILYGADVIASHPRCYGKGQDIYEPLHYLPLLEQRPSALQHAKPLRHRLAGVRPSELTVPLEQTQGIVETHGARMAGSQVHAVRLPGYTISAEIVFGMPDERLALRHDAGSGAEPYVNGALLVVRKVGTLVGLHRGLDRVMAF